MADRVALLVACAHYLDDDLRRLNAPWQDVDGLATLLSNPSVGGFAVETLLDPSSTELRAGLDNFFAELDRDQTALFYFSGHGYRDRHNDFYLATVDTRLDRLDSTAIEGRMLRRRSDRSDSNRQVVILDCCYGAALIDGAKSTSGVGAEIHLADSLHGETDGDGRYYLTSAGRTEFAYEQLRRELDDRSVTSQFTSHLIEGLASGAADLDGDGLITIDELYHFTVSRMKSSVDPDRRQTPQKFVFGQAADAIVVSRAPYASEAGRRFSEAVKLLHHDLPRARTVGLEELRQLLDEDDGALAVRARQALEQAAAEHTDEATQYQAEQLLLQKAAVEAERTEQRARAAQEAAAAPQSAPGALGPGNTDELQQAEHERQRARERLQRAEEAASTQRLQRSGQRPAGLYYAQGDPPGSQRYWDGEQWLGSPQAVPEVLRADYKTSQLQPAGIRHRVLAYAVDLVALLVLYFVLAIPTVALSEEAQQAAVSVVLVVTLALAVWTQIWVQGRTGLTVGKRVAGIRLVDVKSAEPIGPRRALIRLLLIYPAGLLLSQLRILLGGGGQSPLDRWTDTMVVKAPSS